MVPPDTMPHSPPEDHPADTRAAGRLTRQDRWWWLVLTTLGIFIWWRDRTWLGMAGDVLPILAVFPLVWWCGRPWRWRTGGAGVNWEWLTVAALVWIGGIALNMTVLLALAWTLALWSLLAARLEPETLPAAVRLLPLLWLAFPWLVLEADRIGWYFRLSAAATAESLFGALGFHVARQGVLVLVQGLPISVDAECSGLRVLQAMLIAGLVVAHRQFRGSRGYWWALPVLMVAAWCANTLRVLMVSAAALSFGPEFVSGRFHEWSGAVLLVLMFLLCLAGFSWAQRLFRTGEEELTPRLRYWAGMAILLFCALMCGDLPPAWRHSPFDWGGHVILALWLVPVAAARLGYRHKPGEKTPYAYSVLLSAGALMLLMLGTMTSLNLLKHTALGLAAAAFMPRSRWKFLWLALAISWMPVFGWAVNDLGVRTVFGLRLCLGFAALGVGFLGLHRAPVAPAQPVTPTRKSWWRPLALAMAVAVTVLWELVPLPDASARLKTLSRDGFGFASVDVPLSRVEAGIYRDVAVIKRLYRMQSDSVVVVVIDGSKNRHAVHDPLYCFRGGGWQVMAAHRLPLPGGAATRVELERGGERTEAVYWFTDGASRHSSAMRYWWQASLRRLTFGAAGDEPILVVVQPAGSQVGTVDWERMFAQIPELLAL